MGGWVGGGGGGGGGKIVYLALSSSSTELSGCWVSHKLVEGR